jgi:hypothetical protein
MNKKSRAQLNALGAQILDACIEVHKELWTWFIRICVCICFVKGI